MTCEQCKYHDYIAIIDTHFCEDIQECSRREGSDTE